MYSRWNCWVIEQRYVWLYKKLPKSAPTWLYYFFFHLFLLVGGWLLYNIVMVFAIHWHESAMDLHVFPILIPPPASLLTPSLGLPSVPASAIKKNSFESVLMRWMKLESIIQSEISQKDKDQYSILTHIYGIHPVIFKALQKCILPCS